ncbi:MAG TPA: transposase [Nitrospirota bacterium]|nr:transposase [Nitrospirota bacterium]
MIKTCTIRRDGDQWYACFSAEFDPVSIPVPHASVGVDAGLLSFAVLSDGTVINNPMHLRKAEKKLIRKQRRMSRKRRVPKTA